MTEESFRDPVNIGLAAALLAIAGGLVVYRSHRNKPTSEEIERGRREYLLQVGRRIDGTVLDVTDIDQPGSAAGERHIFYKYGVAGVSYECSQEVSKLAAQVVDARLTPGMPASVKYDPHNPSNSIVVAENWTGLRYSNAAAATTQSTQSQEAKPLPQ